MERQILEVDDSTGLQTMGGPKDGIWLDKSRGSAGMGTEQDSLSTHTFSLPGMCWARTRILCLAHRLILYICQSDAVVGKNK